MIDGTSVNALVTELWPDFLAQIPEILATQDPATGRFGTEPFIVNDQNVLWPLAVAWATEPAAGRPNPYHHDQELLAAIIAGGDALIDAADERGQFEFRKKDNSTWGPIYMPWTYSRWIRAWGLIRDAMPADRRAAWDSALTLAVDGIVATALTEPIRNIPAHHAMGVYAAAQVLGRDDWAAAATDYLHRTVAEQDPAGFWSEHRGPVVAYNVVYVDALGCYLGMSGDRAVLPALERAAAFHANLTYPDGTLVETVDERNYYRHSQASLSVGFLASAAGRGYLRWLHRVQGSEGGPVAADTIASMIKYGHDGPAEEVAAERAEHRFVLGADDALVERREPWFATVSAYHGPQGPNRWIQDRQAHLSVYHDAVGLILSGSNTRLQPLWSTFTVGDPALLAHRAGDEDPDFSVRPGLDHLPASATLRPDELGLDLDYAGVPVSVRLELTEDSATVRYGLHGESDRPVAAQAGLVAKLGEPWQAGDHGGTLDAKPIRLTGADCGGWFAHRGWRVTLPDEAVLSWPVLPHNPYTKDGSAEPAEGRIVITLPLPAPGEARLVIMIS
ncbi:hypothetical protein [Microlunatus sp. GCM10028923]|uniref:hypothetical protein n=1 Tax=Microlunatus sp. GCM10028923 TaxID=3273400 RepID=UPI003617ADBA